MSEAFVETTVLTDFLLKRDGSEKRAKQAFAQFSKVTVPLFSWKEYKRGPLRAFVWLHNKLVETSKISAGLLALQRLSRTPQRYLNSTAIQALHTTFLDAFNNVPLGQLVAKYGPKADMDHVQADAMKIELRNRILKWNRRGKLFNSGAHKLTCYPNTNIALHNDLLDITPRDCPLRASCSLQTNLTKSKLQAARQGIPPNSPRAELTRRRKLLRRLAVHPSTTMDRKDCQVFGDAYFVVFCPNGATILTTNLKDIEPMANAMGISVLRP